MKPKRIFFLLGFLLILSILLIPNTASARDPKPATDAYALIAEVNALRAANGLAPYTINATLMSVAQAHSNYQASISTVTHYSADGSRPFQRALSAGYPVGGTLSLGGYFSENIAAGTNLTTTEVIVWWQGDAPHLNTMLSPHLTEVGAGITNVDGYIYYTLDASTPSGGTVVYNTPDPNSTPSGDDTGALPTLDFIMPVITSTPSENGKVIHEVRVGQSLWGIADVYGTTVQEIRALNNMSVDAAIYPGELLLIRMVTVEITSTPILSIQSTSTATKAILTKTSLPTNTPAGMWVTLTPIGIPSEKEENGGNLWIVILIIFSALLMAGFVTWLSGRDRD